MTTGLETQQIFRTIMRAMANPGTIHRLGNSGSTSEIESLHLIADTLLDQDVTFCVIGDHHASALEDTLYERTKSRISDLSLADFIIVTGGAAKGRILVANRGTAEYPDRGATVIFSVESILEASAAEFGAHLSGPGIQGKRYFQLRGIASDMIRHLSELNSGYPLGVDSIFVDNKDCVMCIPRSSKITLR